MYKFSERQYEFALNRELYNRFGNVYIPTQSKEEKLGYDARFRLHMKRLVHPNVLNKRIKFLYVQHKRPSGIYSVSKNHHLKSCGNNVQSILAPKRWSGASIYCFKIYKNNSGVFNQHLMLQKQAAKPNALVLYATPRFIDTRSLNFAMRSNTILDRTAFIDVSLLGNATKLKGSHYVFYDEAVNNKVVMCSEPSIINNVNVSFEGVLDQLKRVDYQAISSLIDNLEIDDLLIDEESDVDGTENFKRVLGLYETIDYLAKSKFSKMNGTCFVLIED